MNPASKRARSSRSTPSINPPQKPQPGGGFTACSAEKRQLKQRWNQLAQPQPHLREAFFFFFICAKVDRRVLSRSDWASGQNLLSLARRYSRSADAWCVRISLLVWWTDADEPLGACCNTWAANSETRGRSCSASNTARTHAGRTSRAHKTSKCWHMCECGCECGCECECPAGLLFSAVSFKPARQSRQATDSLP